MGWREKADRKYPQVALAHLVISFVIFQRDGVEVKKVQDQG